MQLGIQSAGLFEIYHTGATYGGDCMMHIEPHIYRDSTSKTITLSTRNYWGGCRAAGWRQIWIVVEKPPANYSLRFEEIQIDDRN